MNYSCYKEAFFALVAENDGVLPDLYEEINITISCHPVSAPALATVADVVAYAIIETSDDLYATAPVLQPAVSAINPKSVKHKLIKMESLLTQTATCFN